MKSTSECKQARIPVEVDGAIELAQRIVVNPEYAVIDLERHQIVVVQRFL